VNDLVVAALLATGAAWMLIASIGILRMPDVYMRMQASTKASSLAAGLMLGAVALHFGQAGVTARALAAIGFLYLTVPVAAHLIARAAYHAGVPLWEGTHVDELANAADPGPHGPRDPDPADGLAAAPKD